MKLKNWVIYVVYMAKTQNTKYVDHISKAQNTKYVV